MTRRPAACRISGRQKPNASESEHTMGERIAVNPEVHFGKPCVAGTRIPVADVLEPVREGIPFEQIIRDHYPDLEVDDVRACVQYALDVLGVEDLHVTTGS